MSLLGMMSASQGLSGLRIILPYSRRRGFSISEDMIQRSGFSRGLLMIWDALHLEVLSRWTAEPSGFPIEESIWMTGSISIRLGLPSSLSCRKSHRRGLPRPLLLAGLGITICLYLWKTEPRFLSIM